MTNLLRNPSFEAGIHHPGGIEELHIPDEWLFSYATDAIVNPHDPAPHAQFVRPEVRVLGKSDLPPAEHDLFILDGVQTLKIAKDSGSWFAALYQTITLEPGDHRAKIRIFGDLVKRYSGPDKVWADDPAGRDGLFRFIVNSQRTSWHSIIPGQWNTFTHTFTNKPGPIDVTIGADIMCPYPLKNNCIFADAWELEFIAEPEPVIPTEADAVAIFREAWRKMFPPPAYRKNIFMEISSH